MCVYLCMHIIICQKCSEGPSLYFFFFCVFFFSFSSASRYCSLQLTMTLANGSFVPHQPAKSFTDKQKPVGVWFEYVPKDPVLFFLDCLLMCQNRLTLYRGREKPSHVTGEQREAQRGSWRKTGTTTAPPPPRRQTCVRATAVGLHCPSLL